MYLIMNSLKTTIKHEPGITRANAKETRILMRNIKAISHKQCQNKVE